MTIIPQKPKPYGVIYTITNLVNGKQYVGQTTQFIGTRWAQHVRGAILNKDGCRLVERAIRKYGPKSFDVEAVIACDDQEELDRIEQMAIVAGDTLAPNGYNLRSGGSGGRIHPETRAKMKVSMMGKKHKPYPRKPHSPETRAKLSAAMKGKKRKPLSEEHRSRLSSAKRGPNNYRSRPVVRDDGARFASASEASRSMGLDRTSVGNCCRGKQKTCAGHTWRYADEEEKI